MMERHFYIDLQRTRLRQPEPPLMFGSYIRLSTTISKRTIDLSRAIVVLCFRCINAEKPDLK